MTPMLGVLDYWRQQHHHGTYLTWISHDTLWVVAVSMNFQIHNIAWSFQNNIGYGERCSGKWQYKYDVSLNNQLYMDYLHEYMHYAYTVILFLLYIIRE